MRVLMIVAGLLLLTASTAAAASPNDAGLMRCAAIKTDPERLACFDDVVAGMANPLANWQVTQKRDPLTDQMVVTIASRGASTGRRPTLFILRCVAGQAEAYVAFNEYLGRGTRDGGQPVSYRIGDDVIYEDVYWPLSTDKKAVFFAGKMGWLLDNLVKSDRFVVRTTPYNKSPVTATFDLAGLPAALGRVADQCDWEQ